MNEALNLLKKLNINANDYIIVGCSSGPDSMCLLDLLVKNNYRVICAHVNHSIREVSKEEYVFLENYCKKRNIVFEGLTLNSTNAGEYYYRKKRYEFYKSLANKYGTKFIATAHHGDDLIETILMRISRGSNLKGYIGFKSAYKEHEYIILKPLIFYTKQNILEYNKTNYIPYNLDKTNDDETYTRNRYRHKILPFLKDENKNIHKKYFDFSVELAKANAFISNITQKSIKENFLNGVIDLNKFNDLDDYIKEKEIESLLSALYGDKIDKIYSKHIRTILSLINKGKNFKINLPDKKIVKREYNKLFIINEKQAENYNYILKGKVVLPNNYTIEEIKDNDEKSNYVIRLNSEKIKFPLHVRTRKQGDFIEVKNMNGRKKIKNIFIDEKIPQSLRDRWPVITDNEDNIIWLPGIKKSKFDNDKTEKYDIILKYQRKE